MNDLQKHLQQRNVRKTIVEHILAELGIATSTDIDTSTAQVQVHTNEPAKHTQNMNGSIASDPPVNAPPMSISEQEAVQLEPLYIESSRDLEETFRDMHPYFEGKESEGNWLKREKSILKLRKVTKGNAPQEFTTPFLSCIKSLLDGILKTVNSLRTTVSTLGCHLVQDLARVAGPGLDGMVEILLQNLIKLCGNTKKITAAKGNDTVNAILSHVSYHARLTQHVYAASQDKNVQPRSFACGWLKIIINKHGHNKNTIEHAGGLDLIEKCLKAGLVDRDPSVRESMRPTYWAFARRWPDKSEV
jgi:CLIP-associating protein 1/2